MGGGGSFLSTAWRDIDWGDNQRALQYVKDYKPEIEGQELRILLHGPVGAGKSSFINSVQSVFNSRIYRQAFADNISHDSFTKDYKTYKIEKGPKDQNSFYPFVFNDIMGLDKDKGVLVDDVKLALRGHVKDGYRFNPESKLSEGDQFYNNNPTDNDKVHVLVCVVPANTVSLITDEVVQKIREIRKEASDLGIPQLVIITKIDEVCPEIKEDVKNVYKLKKVKATMELFMIRWASL
ncbi:interferon-induced protein 44 isoform X2 [Larimichthys crocea]|uniref:interferon-induced protein 44 isoform X2 n=1 Tax=Larimichthys crocea TaxID=215358 RepID=UPI000F5DE801|nr:interferon-induced protein 44 isoform X2 [Larimichthys crocea]